MTDHSGDRSEETHDVRPVRRLPRGRRPPRRGRAHHQPDHRRQRGRRAAGDSTRSTASSGSSPCPTRRARAASDLTRSAGREQHRTGAEVRQHRRAVDRVEVERDDRAVGASPASTVEPVGEVAALPGRRPGDQHGPACRRWCRPAPRSRSPASPGPRRPAATPIAEAGQRVDLAGLRDAATRPRPGRTRRRWPWPARCTPRCCCTPPPTAATPAPTRRRPGPARRRPRVAAASTARSTPGRLVGGEDQPGVGVERDEGELGRHVAGDVAGRRRRCHTPSGSLGLGVAQRAQRGRDVVGRHAAAEPHRQGRGGLGLGEQLPLQASRGRSRTGPASPAPTPAARSSR